jgi:type 1 glutamine amidotransferase
MSFINYRNSQRILVMTRGHPFNREDFFAIFDAMDGIEACAIEQPASQAFFNPELAADYAAFVLYDMPGLDFNADAPPRYIEPPVTFKNDFLALLESGHGFVFLHHSIAAWPAWPEYAEIIGGRFLYRPDKVRGRPYPDSGYRHDVTHTVSGEGTHPILAGVPARFTITDELYLSHIYEDSVVPLLRSDYSFTDDHFYSANQAVKGNMHSRESWRHPAGSNVVAWIKNFRNSPIVYLQSGDDKAAYDNPAFRMLLRNAINWVASEEAKQWAMQRNAN